MIMFATFVQLFHQDFYVQFEPWKKLYLLLINLLGDRVVGGGKCVFLWSIFVARAVSLGSVNFLFAER